ncbi:MAG TPA: QueG-associated DUF1730 domain-containing protein, partial [Longimicrobiales bacterium]|nr:QueG-associated DUF1730 domain-containing protein [Longimicrobiales bacterium]
MTPTSAHGAAAPSDDRRLADDVLARAHEVGFALAGIAPADASAHGSFYRAWLEAGRHGDMAWMARPDAVARRADLALTLPEVRSCLVVAHEYHTPEDPAAARDPARAVIARYARGRDYHDVVKPKLEELLAWLDARVPGGVRGRA